MIKDVNSLFRLASISNSGNTSHSKCSATAATSGLIKELNIYEANTVFFSTHELTVKRYI